MSYDSNMARKLTKARPAQGTRLVELRRSAGITQAELAELIGEKQQNVAYWEQSDKPPRSDVLPRLADALGVGVEVLLNVDRVVPKRRGGPVGNVRRVFEEVSQLPRREQNKVVEFVSAFVRQHRSQAG
jgi:transcriptional regulator with XRE-family HTH domain